MAATVLGTLTIVSSAVLITVPVSAVLVTGPVSLLLASVPSVEDCANAVVIGAVIGWTA